MTYKQEDLNTDIDWLNGQEIEEDVAKEFIIGLINKGFQMTRKEYTEFMENTTK